MQMIKAAVLALALLAGSAFAGEQGDSFAFCKSIAADTAEAIMEVRQGGLPLADVLEVYGKSEIEAVRSIGRTLAIEAYSRPRFNTYEYQRKAVAEFRDEVHVQCLRELEV